MIKVNIVIGGVIWEAASRYCLQAGISVNEKKEFYEFMDKIVTNENVSVRSEFNGHVGSDMGRFGEVHGVLGLGK